MFLQITGASTSCLQCGKINLCKGREICSHTLIFLTAVKGHNVPSKGVDYDDYVVVSDDAGDTLSHDVMTLQPSPVTSHHHTCSTQT